MVSNRGLNRAPNQGPLPPRDRGYRGASWTLKLLTGCRKELTRVEISTTTTGRLPDSRGIRRERPRRVVQWPAPQARRARRIGQIRRPIETLPPDGAAAWADEMDVDLHLQISPDDRLPGQQMLALTARRNVKRSVAGALNATTNRTSDVTGEKKPREPFLALLKNLSRTSAPARRIHVSRDRYLIHSSQPPRACVASRNGRIMLPFLTPWSPNEQRIARSVWREVHPNMSCNHGSETTEDLVCRVRHELGARNRRNARTRPNVAGALSGSCEAADAIAILPPKQVSRPLLPVFTDFCLLHSAFRPTSPPRKSP